MKIFILTIGLLLSTVTYAKTVAQAECELINAFKFLLNTIALNIANSRTTRTDKGGAYIPKSSSCSNADCKMVDRKVTPIMTYEPSHPDANNDGYVAYPNIDIEVERTNFQVIAENIFAAANEKKCGLSNGQHSNTLIIINDSNAPRTSQSFIKNHQGEIIIWSSQSKDRIMTVNFLNGKSSTL